MPAEVNCSQKDGQERVQVSAAGVSPGDQSNEEDRLYAKFFLGRKEDLEECLKNGKYQPCRNHRESQYRKRPGSFLKEEFDGFPRYPVPNHDHLHALTKPTTANDKALDVHFDDNGPGYRWHSFQESVTIGPGLVKGDPLLLDHHDPGNESKQHV